ncbi:Uncharacterised protein [uncultured Collinsella sp.]|nr:Uncharacterised protein [uncultured Collinsella sp.]
MGPPRAGGRGRVHEQVLLRIQSRGDRPVLSRCAAGVPHHGAGSLDLSARAWAMRHDAVLPVPMGPQLQEPPRLQRDDVQLPVSGESGHRYHAPRCGSLYLEAAWHQLPQPSAGPYARAHDAYDRRGRVPRGCVVGRGRDGSRRGCSVLRHGRKARVPHAVQRDDHGDYLAYRSHRRYAPPVPAARCGLHPAQGVHLP